MLRRLLRLPVNCNAPLDGLGFDACIGQATEAVPHQRQIGASRVVEAGQYVCLVSHGPVEQLSISRLDGVRTSHVHYPFLIALREEVLQTDVPCLMRCDVPQKPTALLSSKEALISLERFIPGR